MTDQTNGQSGLPAGDAGNGNGSLPFRVPSLKELGPIMPGLTASAPDLCLAS